MSEMNENSNEAIQQTIDCYNDVFAELVDIVNPGSGEDPTVVFPKAGEVRCEGEIIELTAKQETDVRAKARELGIGRREDVTAESKGLSDYTVIIGAGLAWKVMAETKLVDGAATIVFEGSPNRNINDAEKAFLEANGIAIESIVTEYDMVQALAKSGLDDPDAEAEVLPIGYDIQNGHAPIEEATGQVVSLGTAAGKKVLLLRVDRENYVDDEGNNKYRNQPDTKDRMLITANVLDKQKIEGAVAYADATTYLLSRDIDAHRAQKANPGRIFVSINYGVDTLQGVKPDAPDQPVLANVLGELNAGAKQLAILERESNAS